MPVDFNEIRELLSAIAQTDIAELTLKSEEFELTLRRGVAALPTAHPGADSSGLSLNPGSSSSPKSSASGSATAEATSAPTPDSSKWVEITSPMVGTFYRAPGPDEPAFVEVGQTIRSGETVCIIEAMKLMNEIEAEISGQVMEIVVNNGEPIEYGQTLMRINPES
ncbi:MAG: acetyl-CoA carboxylase biotin carboxyl carrier protein [Oscillatoria sp. PMC 1068.18]|nr:acetyl-CoA carboxylase biotin carboxyl carrier protein [Oscillatoria sp. PMC 1076.18]MEC4988907.1 acetyl-CoA carboxylase biotin carboxyl carrier protein [Oscillatoria sp. PMC 1068.18]